MMSMRMAVVAGVLVAGSGVALAQGLSSEQTAQILRQAREYTMAFRTGQNDAPDKAAAMLEAATAAEPSNGALLAALAQAYYWQAALAGRPGGNPANGFTLIIKAAATAERAVALDDSDPVAVANAAAGRVLTGLFQQKPALITQGLADMDRAIAMRPELPGPHVTRAFFGINLPPQLRNNTKVVEDLKFLTVAATGSRAGDMVHVMLGDFFAEIGRPDDARREYEAAGRRPASAARDLAAGRVSALAGSGVPPDQIATLRGAPSNDCVFCHAK
jgi:hypothetical protein